MPWDEMHAHTPGDLAGLAEAPRDRAVMDSTTAERDHAGAEQAHRDDLARDEAREWTAAALNWGPPVSTVREVYPNLSAALDRLAAAYGE